jgi:hypothetical protein
VKSPKLTRQELIDAVPIKQDGWTERDACEWTAAFVNGETVDRMKAIIANDAWAISFQTMGQYRSAILKMLNT